jgi:hypothetical protein
MTVSYPYYNEAGEPLMDGAAMRYEMYLDSTYEPDPDAFYDRWDDEPDEIDPADCSHTENWTGNDDGTVTCDDCYTEGVVLSRDENGWIDEIQWEVV